MVGVLVPHRRDGISGSSGSLGMMKIPWVTPVWGIAGIILRDSDPVASVLNQIATAPPDRHGRRYRHRRCTSISKAVPEVIGAGEDGLCHQDRYRPAASTRRGTSTSGAAVAVEIEHRRRRPAGDVLGHRPPQHPGSRDAAGGFASSRARTRNSCWARGAKSPESHRHRKSATVGGPPQPLGMVVWFIQGSGCSSRRSPRYAEPPL